MLSLFQQVIMSDWTDEIKIDRHGAANPDKSCDMGELPCSKHATMRASTRLQLCMFNRSQRTTILKQIFTFA